MRRGQCGVPNEPRAHEPGNQSRDRRGRVPADQIDLQDNLPRPLARAQKQRQAYLRSAAASGPRTLSVSIGPGHAQCQHQASARSAAAASGQRTLSCSARPAHAQQQPQARARSAAALGLRTLAQQWRQSAHAQCQRQARPAQAQQQRQAYARKSQRQASARSAAAPGLRTLSGSARLTHTDRQHQAQ